MAGRRGNVGTFSTGCPGGLYVVRLPPPRSGVYFFPLRGVYAPSSVLPKSRWRWMREIATFLIARTLRSEKHEQGHSIGHWQ